MAKKRYKFGKAYVDMLLKREVKAVRIIFSYKPHTRNKYRDVPKSIKLTKYERLVRPAS